jgi:hypothetical protein
MKQSWTRWWILVLFAVAMAWMESATVVYLRNLVGRLDPYQQTPLPDSPHLGATELVREAATLVMLVTVGWLAGRTWRSRFGYLLIAFGVWDIFYYIFLKWICGWPRTLSDWDVLFLLPLPWWGPVLSPMLIALLMVLGGTFLSQYDRPERPLWPHRWSVAANCAGVVLALYVFMADALRLLPQGTDAIRRLLPTYFNWPLFLVALFLMAVPVGELARRVWLPQGRNGGRASSRIQEGGQ